MDFTTYLAAAVIAAFSNHFHVTPGADEVTRLTGVAVDMYAESATGYVDADETGKLHLPFDGPAKRQALAHASLTTAGRCACVIRAMPGERSHTLSPTGTHDGRSIFRVVGGTDR